MADNELRIAGIGISKDVVSAVVSHAAGNVAGVASVGGNDTIASNLINVFTNKSMAPGKAVESVVENDTLRIGVHLAVFYGYPFTKLAADVRGVVATVFGTPSTLFCVPIRVSGASPACRPWTEIYYVFLSMRCLKFLTLTWR